MTRHPELVAPEGTTAHVKTSAKVTRVVLPVGVDGRWFRVAVCALWLCAWTVDWLARLSEFWSRLSDGGLSRNLGGLFAPAVWTLGEVVSVFVVLAVGWSAYVFTVTPDGWTYRENLGPLYRTRRFRRGQVQHVRLSEHNDVLVVETGHQTVELTHGGTPADARWLRDVLWRASGLPDRPANDPAPRGIQ